VTPAPGSSATSRDHEHFGRIAGLMTPSRRAVLEALAECGPMTAAQIADCWKDRDPSLRPLVAQALPSMVSQSLWKLESLDLVQVVDKVVTITALGREQLGEEGGRDDTGN
jgi:Fe2+ or Zn2+ uptake regulation protein